jgi:hypothetical protein
MADEKRALAIEHDGTTAAFDDIGVEFDATVVWETDEPVLMVQAVADLFGDCRLRRHFRFYVFHKANDLVGHEPANSIGCIDRAHN